MKNKYGGMNLRRTSQISVSVKSKYPKFDAILSICDVNFVGKVKQRKKDLAKNLIVSSKK